MSSEKSTRINPSQPPLAPARGTPVGAPLLRNDPSAVRGGAEKLVDDKAARNFKAHSNPSPDKGRPGGVKGFIPYNKKLTFLARENRKNPTAPESKMWNEVLRMRHFADHKFLRQKPIADFIVDFYCAELRLAIEIDGDSHAESVEYDAGRTAVLNANGITLVRYDNSEVMNNLEGLYDDLLRRHR